MKEREWIALKNLAYIVWQHDNYEDAFVCTSKSKARAAKSWLAYCKISPLYGKWLMLGAKLKALHIERRWAYRDYQIAVHGSEFENVCWTQLQNCDKAIGKINDLRSMLERKAREMNNL